MAVKITKYLFDTEFLPDMAHLEGENSVGWDVPPTREEVEAARAESFSAGHAAGRAEAEAESLRIQAHVLRQFAEQFVALKQSQEAILRESTKDAVAIALAVGRKLAETLVAAHPLVEIESLLAHCLSRLMGEARIVLRTHDSLLDALQERIDEVTRRSGFDGHIILLGDETIALGDCRIEWADGGGERDMSKLAGDIEISIRRMVQAGVADAPEGDPVLEIGEQNGR